MPHPVVLFVEIVRGRVWEEEDLKSLGHVLKGDPEFLPWLGAASFFHLSFLPCAVPHRPKTTGSSSYELSHVQLRAK